MDWEEIFLPEHFFAFWFGVAVKTGSE